MEPEAERIYWKNDFNGEAKGGYYFRNVLRDHIKRVEEETGSEVVGIKYDATYNLELIVGITIAVVTGKEEIT